MEQGRYCNWQGRTLVACQIDCAQWRERSSGFKWPPKLQDQLRSHALSFRACDMQAAMVRHAGVICRRHSEEQRSFETEVLSPTFAPEPIKLQNLSC